MTSFQPPIAGYIPTVFGWLVRIGTAALSLPSSVGSSVVGNWRQFGCKVLWMALDMVVARSHAGVD